MAVGRPEKRTVDYFSHDAGASHGRTVGILFTYFRHEGISAWWLLLEKLAASEGHVIDIRDEDSFVYLASEMYLSIERLKEILDKMASLNAIDRDLYHAGYIWSDNFVKRLSALYKERKQGLPPKPMVNRVCAVCNANISHLRLNALYCSEKCRQQGRRHGFVTDISKPGLSVTEPVQNRDTSVTLSVTKNDHPDTEETSIIAEPVQNRDTENEAVSRISVTEKIISPPINAISPPDNSISRPDNSISRRGNSQSKVNKSKVNKSKESIRENSRSHNCDTIKDIPHQGEKPSGEEPKDAGWFEKASEPEMAHKSVFGELANVNLTPDEHGKLITRFGAQGATDRIDELSLAKASKGYKTKSDYATILAWEHRKLGGVDGGDQKHFAKVKAEVKPAKFDPTKPLR